ncbi:hypothetical protein PR048_010330 [Dryococelus australis]|uniref:Uncharacterized protein n=1 Tax=Dryococelus australis TaxID=614101 RepID=A0ABQ9I2G3_9NEOP|nr:hypothetical protein PR048_010330 [Dryococelus australis]
MSGLKTFHFLSDSPINQYQKRIILYLTESFLREKLEADCIHEEGHGKGVPDGVGGFLKRAADRLTSNRYFIIKRYNADTSDYVAEAKAIYPLSSKT